MNSPYVKQAPSVSSVMLKVLLALLPAIVVSIHFFGIGIVIQIVLATIAAWVTEYILLVLRRYPVRPFLLDGSVTVTAWLIALSFPSLAAWWMVVLATVLAVILAKHLYGGLGNNLFNPAMVGYAIMIISFPAQMSRYRAPDILLHPFDELRYIFMGRLPDHLTLDAITSATPLDAVKTIVLSHGDIDAVLPQLGWVAGIGIEWIALAYLAGGLFLLQQRLIPWQIPLGMLLGVGMLAGGLHLFDPTVYPGIGFHWLGGAVMLGAFFIATDPVTGPTTPLGRFIFAFFCGVLTYIIRVFGGFPDGVAFAVLLMNIAVPLIDQYTQPAVFGRQRKK